MRFLLRLFCLSCLGLLLSCTPEEEKDQRPINVLFIIADDLRPELGCYGQRHVISPNIDSFAAGATLFERAYCAWPVCGPSRASVMSGMRPDHSGIYRLPNRVDEFIPDMQTMPQHFRAYGYEAYSVGKVFHNRGEDSGYWSMEPWRPDFTQQLRDQMQDFSEESLTNWAAYASIKSFLQREEEIRENGSSRNVGPAVEAADMPDSVYNDYRIASKAIELMEDHLAASDTVPFFLAVGFQKPHLPFAAPRKFWDQYNRDEIPVNWTPARGEGVNSTRYTWMETTAYGAGIGNLPDDVKAREMIHGYLACVSMIDEQVGRLLDALERSGQAENTVVVLWGDHGFQLGEEQLWGKHCPWENSAKAPLIIRAPGMPTGSSRAVVEFIDFYPTLADLCSLPYPEQLDGQSLVPVLEDPSRPGKGWSLTQYSHWNPGFRHQLAYSLRVDSFRLIEWRDYVADTLISRELYGFDAGKEVPMEFDLRTWKRHEQPIRDLLNSERRLQPDHVPSWLN